MVCVRKHGIDRRRKRNEELPPPVALDRGGATVGPERRRSCPQYLLGKEGKVCLVDRMLVRPQFPRGLPELLCLDATEASLVLTFFAPRSWSW